MTAPLVTLELRHAMGGLLRRFERPDMTPSSYDPGTGGGGGPTSSAGLGDQPLGDGPFGD